MSEQENVATQALAGEIVSSRDFDRLDEVFTAA